MEIIAVNYKLILLTLAVFNLAVSALFLIWPNFLIRLNEALQKPVYAAKILTPLDRVRLFNIDVAKTRKTLGLVSLLTALVLIFIANQY